jgi:chromate transporter
MVMNDHSLVQIAVTFALLSLVAVGGANAVLPDMHRQVVDTLHWMNNADFARAFAIAQTAPGPNIIIVSVIGWRVAGWAGLVTATLAMVTPSCLVAFGVSRLFNRVAKAPWFSTVKNGLAPVPIGLLLASGVVLARASDVDALSLGLTGIGAGFVLATRSNPVWILAVGAVLGVIAGRLGLW